MKSSGDEPARTVAHKRYVLVLIHDTILFYWEDDLITSSGIANLSVLCDGQCGSEIRSSIRR